METIDVVASLSALAQETRLRIFRELIKAHSPCANGGGLAAGKLSLLLDIPPPTLSFHLKELTRARLIESRRQGRSVIYRARLDSMSSLLSFLLEDCCGGACGLSLSASSSPLENAQ